MDIEDVDLLKMLYYKAQAGKIYMVWFMLFKMILLYLLVCLIYILILIGLLGDIK
jgi:hypothetical protein